MLRYYVHVIVDPKMSSYINEHYEWMNTHVLNVRPIVGGQQPSTWLRRCQLGNDWTLWTFGGVTAGRRFSPEAEASPNIIIIGSNRRCKMAMPMFAVDSMFWEQLLWYIMIHWIENVSGATTKMWSTVDTDIFGMRLSNSFSTATVTGRRTVLYL